MRTIVLEEWKTQFYTFHIPILPILTGILLLVFFEQKLSRKTKWYGSLIPENDGLEKPFVRTMEPRENDVLLVCA